MDLREENELLREENRQLKERLALSISEQLMSHMRAVLGVQPQCVRLLNALMAVPIGRKEHLFEAMSPMWAKSDAEMKGVDVRIYHLRVALRKHGIEIETVWGVGYRLAPEMKARVRAVLQPEQAAEAA